MVYRLWGIRNRHIFFFIITVLLIIYTTKRQNLPVWIMSVLIMRGNEPKELVLQGILIWVNCCLHKLLD